MKKFTTSTLKYVVLGTVQGFFTSAVMANATISCPLPSDIKVDLESLSASATTTVNSKELSWKGTLSGSVYYYDSNNKYSERKLSTDEIARTYNMEKFKVYNSYVWGSDTTLNCNYQSFSAGGAIHLSTDLQGTGLMGEISNLSTIPTQNQDKSRCDSTPSCIPQFTISDSNKDKNYEEFPSHPPRFHPPYYPN